MLNGAYAENSSQTCSLQLYLKEHIEIEYIRRDIYRIGNWLSITHLTSHAQESGERSMSQREQGNIVHWY